MIIVVFNEEVHQTNDVSFRDVDVTNSLPYSFIKDGTEIIIELFALSFSGYELDKVFFLSDFQDVGTQELLERR